MPRQQQDVIALCVWSALSYEEAAAALGAPVGTVRSRLSRAAPRWTLPWRNSTALRDIKQVELEPERIAEDMTEIPNEFPLPEEAARRQLSMLSAHVEVGRRSAANQAPGALVAVASVILVGVGWP